MNISKVRDKEVMMLPAQMIKVEQKRQRRPLKTCDRRPISGAREDMAIKYEDVSQLTFSKASRSAAIAL
jgi:hypothetical protein